MSADLDLDALAELSGALDAADLERLAGEGIAPPVAPRSGSTSRVTVTLEDGTVFDVTLDGRDRRAYALYADRYKLPRFTIDAGDVDVLKLELLTVFSAWHATRWRLKLHALDWPAFNAAVLDVVVDTDAPEVAPHPPDRGVG